MQEAFDFDGNPLGRGELPHVSVFLLYCLSLLISYISYRWSRLLLKLKLNVLNFVVVDSSVSFLIPLSLLRLKQLTHA